MPANQPEPHFSWSHRRLVARHTASGHDGIAQGIEYFRENGVQQVVIEACVISGPPDSIAEVYSNWQIVDTELPPGHVPAARQHLPPSPFASSWSGKAAVQQGSVVETRERRQPAMCAVLEEDDAKTVLARVQANPQLLTVGRPQVATISGQHAVATVISQRPFVVGFKQAASNKPEPQIRVVPTGWSMRILPLPQRDNQVKRECQLEPSRIIDVPCRSVVCLVRMPNLRMF